jgi:ABC-type amino acid transport system permease subunit
MQHIIIPQMIGNSLPLFIAEMISIAKDVSILTVFGFMELFSRGNIIGNINYNYGRSMILVGLIYYGITFLISRLEYVNVIKKIFKYNHK